jgi:hypothetical protein
MSVTISRIDFKKEMKHLYTAPTGGVVEVNVAAANYLMVDGRGDPNTSKVYREALEALFSTAYPLKFAVKKQHGVDYGVLPLEGLWWMDNGKAFQREDKNSWCWTAMIMQPEFITQELVEHTLAEVRKKKKLPGLDRIRLERLEEGKCVQTLHIGPYSEENEAVARLHSHANEHGYALHGKHHEIYLNTPERTAPEKLKTVLRQPVR